MAITNVWHVTNWAHQRRTYAWTSHRNRTHRMVWAYWIRHMIRSRWLGHPASMVAWRPAIAYDTVKWTANIINMRMVYQTAINWQSPDSKWTRCICFRWWHQTNWAAATIYRIWHAHKPKVKKSFYLLLFSQKLMALGETTLPRAKSTKNQSEFSTQSINLSTNSISFATFFFLLHAYAST